MPDSLEAAASKITKDINTPKVESREEATHLLVSAMQTAKPADIKQLADKVTEHVDMHALGLDGFKLAEDKPAGFIPIAAKDSDDHKAHNLAALKFTSADGKQNVLLLANGAEYDMATSKQLRTADATVPATPPADAPPTPLVNAADKVTPVTPGSDAATKPGKPATPGDATSDADKAKVLQLIQKKVDDDALSDPVKRGEGYYQVIKRMHPELTPEDAVKQARHMRDLNGGNTSLKVGDRLPLKTDDEKKAQVQAALDQFNSLSPADKAAAVAAAKTAFPDAPAGTPPAPVEATPAAAKTPADAPPTTTPPPDAPPAAAKTPADAPPTTTPPPDAPPAAAKTPADAPPTTTPPPDAPPAAAPDAPPKWAPKLNPAGNELVPTGDPNHPETLIYNPMAPIGLTAGQPGKNLDKAQAGVADRQITPGKDGKGESIKGDLNDATWLSAWLAKTGFTTNDTLQDGKLSGRVTQYSSAVDMKFQGPAGHEPIAIHGVTKIQTVMDAGNNGYTTAVTDSNNKTYSFSSDEEGKVLSYTPPAS